MHRFSRLFALGGIVLVFSANAFAGDLGITPKQFEKRFNSFLADLKEETNTALLKRINVKVDSGAVKDTFLVCPAKNTCIIGGVDKKTGKVVDVTINGRPEGTDTSVLTILSNMVVGSSAAIPVAKNFNSTNKSVLKLVNQETDIVGYGDYRMSFGISKELGMLLLTVEKSE